MLGLFKFFSRQPPVDAKSFPGIVGLETVNTCNARCPFCPLFQGVAQIDRQIRPAKVMDQALFTACISELAQWERLPETIFLNMDGEPLLDPLFKERLATVHQFKLGPRVDLQSNGQYLSGEMSKAIIQAGVRRLTLGFDGATKETYTRHRVNCDYEKVLANIREFTRIRDESRSKTRIAIQYVRTTQNAHEVLDAYHLFNDFLKPGQDVFQDNLAKDWGDRDGDGTLFYLPHVKGGPDPIGCSMFDSQLIVHADGILAACCWDYNLVVSNGGFGNVGELGLLHAWRGMARQEARKRVQSRDRAQLPEKCANCTVMYPHHRLDINEAKLAGTRVTVGETSFTYAFETRTAH